MSEAFGKRGGRGREAADRKMLKDEGGIMKGMQDAKAAREGSGVHAVREQRHEQGYIQGCLVRDYFQTKGLQAL